MSEQVLGRALFRLAVVALLCVDAFCVFLSWAFVSLTLRMQSSTWWTDPRLWFALVVLASVAALVAAFWTGGDRVTRLLICASPPIVIAVLLLLVVIAYPI